MRHLRLVRAPVHPGSCVRRVRLRLLPWPLRYLWRRGRVRRVLLQGVHATRKGCAWKPSALYGLLVLLLTFGLALFSLHFSPYLTTLSLSLSLSRTHIHIHTQTHVHSRFRRLLSPCFVYPSPSFPLQRDGCPKVINIGAARADLFYER